MDYERNYSLQLRPVLDAMRLYSQTGLSCHPLLTNINAENRVLFYLERCSFFVIFAVLLLDGWSEKEKHKLKLKLIPIMAKNYKDLRKMAQNAKRAFEMEHERLMKQKELFDACLKLMDIMEKVMDENEQLRKTVEEYQQQLNEEKQQRAALEMKLEETNKLMTGMTTA